MDFNRRNGSNVFCHHNHLFKQVQVKRSPKNDNSNNRLFIYAYCWIDVTDCFPHLIIIHKPKGDFMKRKKLGCIVIFITILLSGCMYPDEKLSQNEVPYQDQLKTVQTAVDEFQKDNGGILPIKTKDAKTPTYQKYPIDFKKIAPKYIAEPPGNAFESGGIFQYVLVDVETNPTVKLFDLRMSETISNLKLRINSSGYPPYKKQIAKNVFTLDYKQLGYEDEPYVISPFTNQNLSLVISGNAEIYVDYRPDLYQAIKKTNISLKAGEDIRSILVTDSMFVPAYSLPYTIDSKTNEPVFLEE